MSQNDSQVDILNTTYQGHHLVVSTPTGGGSYHVLIDNYYVGQIVPSPTGWLPFIKSDVLQGDDVAALLDLIGGVG